MPSGVGSREDGAMVDVTDKVGRFVYRDVLPWQPVYSLYNDLSTLVQVSSAVVSVHES